MKRRLFGALCACGVAGAVVPAWVWAQRSDDDAVALVKAAVAFYQGSGRAATVAAINNPKGQFVDKELYVFAIDTNGVIVANGANPWAVGKKILESKDGQGKYYIKSAIEMSKTEPSGWVDYVWPNASTRAPEPKNLYFEKIDDIIIGCSIGGRVGKVYVPTR